MKLLYGSGLEETRTQDIREALIRIKTEMGELSLNPLMPSTNPVCERFLTSLPGVGTKSARCLMMYTLGRKTFPADAHCIRVLSRIGVIRKSRDHREDQEKLADLVPANLAYKLHVNLVAHGQEICSAANPRCTKCPLTRFCKTPRSQILTAPEKHRDGPTVVDLFCGAGGTSFGLARAGYRIKAAIDNDSWACQTYRLNHPEVDPDRIVCKDIHEVRASNLLDPKATGPVDLLVGGPPCQGFSTIGARIRGANGEKRFINDPRNELYKEFVRLVRNIKPRVVVMENVLGLFSLKNGYYRDQILQDLNHGYATRAVRVNTHAFAVPQRRLRALFVGISGAHFGDKADVIVTNIMERLGSFRNPGPTLSQAIADLPKLDQNDGGEVCRKPTRRGRLSAYALEMGAGSQTVIFNHVSRPLNIRDQLLYGLLEPGEKGHDAVEKHGARHLMVYRDDIFHDKYRRLVYEKPSPTVMAHMAKDGHMFIHPDPDQNRSLTVREAARIQSFPDDFIFYGPRTYQFQHVGNAVPPRLAERIGAIIRQEVVAAGHVW